MTDMDDREIALVTAWVTTTLALSTQLQASIAHGVLMNALQGFPANERADRLEHFVAIARDTLPQLELAEQEVAGEA